MNADSDGGAGFTWHEAPYGAYMRFNLGMHPSVPDSAWDELHLQPGAPIEVVTAAYRALARLHHPDRWPPQEREERTRKMVRINAAYDQIRKQDG